MEKHLVAAFDELGVESLVCEDRQPTDYFSKMDTDNNSVVSRREFEHFFISKGEKKAPIRDFLRDDANRDGVLNWHEFAGSTGTGLKCSTFWVGNGSELVGLVKHPEVIRDTIWVDTWQHGGNADGVGDLEVRVLKNAIVE